MTRAYLYARFSPRPGETSCQSNVRQLEQLRKYAAEHDMDIVGEEKDDAKSGGDGLDERPGLRAVLDAIKRGNVLLVESYSRLSRDLFMREGLLLDLARRKVKVISITEENANGEDDTAWLLRTIIGVVDEFERRRTRKRSSDRARQSQAAGLLRSNLPPAGYRHGPVKVEIVNGKEKRIRTLEADPDEQAAIELIKEWRKVQTDMPLKTIADALNRHGFQFRGKPWKWFQVRRALLRQGSQK